MTTLSVSGVRSFTSNLIDRMDRYDISEPIESATPDAASPRYDDLATTNQPSFGTSMAIPIVALDAALLHFAEWCGEFRYEVRQWKQAVFTGREVYDHAFDSELRNAGSRLSARAHKILEFCQRFTRTCDPLNGQSELQDALRDLDKLLKGWVTPKLAVGPGPRRWSMPDSDPTDETRQAIKSLPPLPADWEPDDPDQKAIYRELRNS
jgi:hypothetical protein